MIFLIDEAELKKNDNYALYFYATWMPFHKRMVKIINTIENKYKVNFTAIDVDNYKSLCKKYTIEAVPTILIFKDNKEIKRIKGIVLSSALKAKFGDIFSV